MKLYTNLIQKLILLLIVFSFTCIAVNALPDLTINTAVLVNPDPACDGQKMAVIFDVKNIGDTNVYNANADIYVNNIFDQRIYGINVTAGGSKKIIAAVTARNYGSMPYIKLDPDNVINEGTSGQEDNNLKIFLPTIQTCSNSYTNTPLQRYTNGVQMDRFYTTNSGEVPSGFSFDHNEGKVSTAWVSGTTPWFQFYHTGATSHYYMTKTDQPSLQGALNNNYAYEKVQGYIYTYQASGTTPLYHLYHQTRIEHFYTISIIERDNAIENLGFLDKGIEGYVYPNDPVYTYDLQAIDIWTSGTPTAGQSTIIYYQVKNNNSSISSYNVAVYLDNVLQGYETKYNIGAGEYATGSLSITASQGNHNVKIFVDYGNQWNEINENNNNLTEVIYWQAAPLPAPKTASFNNSAPVNGSSIRYTYNIEAYKMDSDYRTMIHFLDDNNQVIINDDHWLNDTKGFKTNSVSFTGNITYTKNVTIPSNFSGRLRMTTGFYNLSTPNIRANLSIKYVPELWYGEYLVGTINVTKTANSLPAPKLAVFSNDPVSGEDFEYMYRIEAHPMNKSYRTMMHFVDNQGNIVKNDDHWIKDETGFNTSSASFEGYIEYTRTINIPAYFTGNLSIVTGFYDYDNNILGERVPLDPQYVTDINYSRYLVGKINVTPFSEYRVALEVGGQDPRIETLPASFPELFVYDADKNENLAQALLYISDSFRKKGITVNKELLIAVMATLRKEVGGSFLPIEEGGDFGMGTGCTYKIKGSCRTNPYSGGLDYKGRGYIQITHDYNYRSDCGEDCTNPLSSPEKDICKCKNQWHCLETDVTVCPQIKALFPDRAADIFASYYIRRNLVTKANAGDYSGVGAGINGGTYPAEFKAIADTYVTLFNNNPTKLNALLLALGNENPYREGTRVKEVGDNKIYLVENGKFRHIVDETSFCYNITNDLTQLSKFKEIPAGEISRLNALGEDITAPASFYSTPLPPAEGTLVKDVCSIDVYVYEGGKYRWIVDEDTFNAKGYKFSDVVTVSYNRIAQQNNYGTPIKYAPNCALSALHNNSFIDVDTKDLNYQNVVLMKNLTFSYPLDVEVNYNPSSIAPCGNNNVCVNYRGDYSGSREGLGSHAGIDITAPAFTTKVYAMADGILVKDSFGTPREVLSAYGADLWSSNCYKGFCPGWNGGYGGMVIIEHPDILINGQKLYSVYMHLRYFNTDLKVGDPIKAGTWIGNLSNGMGMPDNQASGTSTGPHLHFQLQLPYNSNCKNPWGKVCSWPYEAQNWTATYDDDTGFLNTYTVNPLKFLNTVGYYMPQDLKTYYNCMQSVDASGLGSQEIRNVDILYPYTNNVRLAWTGTPSATYQIALSKTNDFSMAQLVESSAPHLDIEVDDTPTFAKVKSLATSWSPQFILYNNESKICSQLDRYIDNYTGCGLSIENSEINSNAGDSVVIRDSNITNSQIHGNYTIENAVVENNIMDSGIVYWGPNYFNGHVELSKIKPDCIETTNIEIKGPSSFKICPGTYSDTLKVSTSNISLDLSQVTITGGIFGSSGYTVDQASADLQGINGSTTKAQIDAVLGTKPMLENITIINGNFVNCNEGINISFVKNAKISNNTFTNCQSGIIAIGINSEITGNTITLDSSSPGYAIALGGMDSLILSNTVTGDYENGIGMLGWNLTADSNLVSEANNGIGIIGFYNNVNGNEITNTINAVSGIFVLGANISNNRMATNENGLSVICLENSTVDSNTIIASSNKAIDLKQFLNNKCSKDGNITNNKLVQQNIPAINIMGTLVENDSFVYGNNVINNTYCETEIGCGIIIPPAPKTYTIVYVPGELRNISGVIMNQNIENISDWKPAQMQKINGTYQITFENVLQGEKDFNIQYNVDGVANTYYAITTQGFSGDVYVNGIKLDCDYTGYYPHPPEYFAANYKIVADGEGNFTKPSSATKLPACTQLCEPTKLNQRVAWLSNGSMYVPSGVFTGNCYKEKDGINEDLIFNCPVAGKNIKLGGWFDVWARTVNFTAQNSQSCGVTDTTFNQKFYAANIGNQSLGFGTVYSEGGYNYWFDLNPCHPDVILVNDGTHKILPSSRTTTNPICG